MNIYVSHLNYSTTDADLQELFSQYGEIASAKVIMDRETGRSRGFAFVEMTEDEAAQKAIDGLDRTDFQGNNINVRVANPRPEHPAGERRSFDRPRSGSYDKKRY